MSARTRRHARRLQVPFRGYAPFEHNASVRYGDQWRRVIAERKVLARWGSFGAACGVAAAQMTAFAETLSQFAAVEAAKSTRLIEISTPEHPSTREAWRERYRRELLGLRADRKEAA